MSLLSRTVFTIILLLCIVQAVYYYPLLPEQVASHFGASGRPDAWSSKESFVKIYFFVMAFVTFFFGGIGFVMKKVPDSMINLPNKGYWLAPERRQDTIDALVSQFRWFGSATLLLLLDIFNQSFKVHLGQAQTLEHPVVSIVVYAAFTMAWSIVLIVKFMRRPE